MKKMKKITSLSLIGILFSVNLFANEGLSLGKLKKIPLNLDFLSTENGGNKTAIDAYSDGVGIYTVGLEDKKFSAMNELVFKHGEEAKKAGETLKDYVISNGNNKEQELAALLGTNSSGTVIGGLCDDGNSNTENDRYIDTNGTCQGTETKNSVKCKGDPVGSEFLVDGVSYLVVDNNIIKDNLNRAETLCTSNVTDMTFLFAPLDSNFDPIITYYDNNVNLNNWDTSNVTIMEGTFALSNFNGNISNWDTSNVVNMTGTFALSNFNGNISNWDTSNVTDMNWMFQGALSFNQNISTWNISSTGYIKPGQFDESSALEITNQPNFNGKPCDDGNENTINDVYNNGTCQGTEAVVRSENKCENDPIGSEIHVDGINYLVVDNNTIRNNLDRAETLCTSNVTNMSRLFEWEYEDLDLSNWDTSHVTDMQYMFFNNYYFNNNSISNWDVSNVINMQGMFSNSYFDQNISNWDVSNVTNMSDMFSSSTFNQNIDSWNVSNVTNMSNMFNNSWLFNQNISSWNTINVVSMRSMFEWAVAFNQPLNNWNVENVTDMYGMFHFAYNFNQPLNNWNVSNVSNFNDTFNNAHAFNQPLNNWNINTIGSVQMIQMFSNASTFNQPLNNWNTSHVYDMNSMFYNATSFNQNISGWDISSVGPRKNYFSYGSSLTYQNTPFK